jgi:hypothetical protein
VSTRSARTAGSATSRPPARRGAGATVTLGVVAAVVVALGGLALALTTNGAVLRLCGGALFVVVVGYCVTTLLGLSRGDRVETATLSLGLGLAATVVAGLLLDIIEGLDPAGWVGFVALLGGSTVLVGLRRLRRGFADGPVDEDDALDVAAPAVAPERTSWGLVAVTGVVCVAAVSIALAIAVRSAHEQTGAGFTTLAVDTASLERDDVVVVVENRERVPAWYRLVATAGDQVVLTVDRFDLAADDQVRHDVPVGALAPGTVVDVALYRDGGTDPYRRVTVTVR